VVRPLVGICREGLSRGKACLRLANLAEKCVYLERLGQNAAAMMLQERDAPGYLAVGAARHDQR
jgi:hypothetical protein